MKKLLLCLFCLLIGFSLVACGAADEEPIACLHRDADDNAKCDVCGEAFEDGKDVTEKPACQHKDVDKDHSCDLRCGQTLGVCEDADKDHACDYGCGETFGVCEDSLNHKDGLCDYGCQKKFPITMHSNGVEFVSNGDGTCYVEGIKFSEYKDLIIPPFSPSGDRVVSIRDYAFNDCYNLTSVTIPDGLISIGKGAFAGCDGITKVILSDSVEFIGYNAFSGCDGITEVVLPDSVKFIGYNVFSGCSNLLRIVVNEKNTIYKSVDGNLYTKDGKTLVRYCVGKAATSFTVPSGVETIGDYAFAGCESLVSVTIGDAVQSIGNHAFRDCNSLTSVAIGNKIQFIGDYAFYDCDTLTSVTMTGAPMVGVSAFLSCGSALYTEYAGGTYVKVNGQSYTILSALTDKDRSSYSIHSDTRFISGSVFNGCEKAKSITIPAKVETIGDLAFYGCESLTSVTIPDRVENIGYEAFSYCTSLKNVTIGKGVKSIGNFAFESCTSLSSVTISGAPAIGRNAFFDCSPAIYTEYAYGKYVKANGNPYAILMDLTDENFSTYDIHQDTMFIGGSAFEYCTSLESIIIGNGVKSIGFAAFGGCTSLESITLPCVFDRFGYIFGALGYIGGTSTQQSRVYCIPTSLKSVTLTIGDIPDSAFCNCSMITNVTIENAVNSIGDSAFENCKGLTKLTILGAPIIEKDAFSACNSALYTEYAYGKYVKANNNPYAILHTLTNKNRSTYEIHKDTEFVVGSAFNNCAKLTGITIPDKVKTIGNSAFAGCISLTSVTIGTAIEAIGTSAFSNCYKLVEIINQSSLNIQAGSKDYGDVAYYAKEVHAEESKIDHVGDYLFYTYDNVHYLLGYVGNDTDIKLPNSYKGESYEIYQYAFYNRDDLTSVVIGNSVESIGSSAFSGCNSLMSIKYRGTKTQWNAISKGSSWKPVSCTIIYNYTGA